MNSSACGLSPYPRLRVTHTGIGGRARWGYNYISMKSCELSLYCRFARKWCLNGTAAVILMVLPHICTATTLDDLALLEQLRTDYAAMVAAEHEYRLQRERGALSSRETEDYAAYVARLHRFVAEDCRSVMEADIVVPQDVVCPTVQAVPVPADIDIADEQTRVEKTGDLDARLMAELGDFDEMLLREQERVKASAPRTDAGGGGAGGGGSGSDGAGGDAGNARSGDAAGGASGAASGEGRNGSSTAQQGSAGGASGSGQGSGQGSGATAPGSWNQSGTPSDRPDDIPDGSDDDVVARQLREAAEKETDPELREKLWEEYRRYKQGTR